MKTFRVEVMTKGTFEVEIARIDTDKYDVNDIDSEVFEDILHGFDGFESEFVVTGGMGDDWDGTFEMTVYDEDENVVYESNDFTDFKFVTGWDDEELEGTSKQTKQNIKQRIESDIAECCKPGMYAVRADNLKWYGFTFTVEDEEFNPDKLIFVVDKKLEGLVYDYMTHADYVMYGDNFVDAECDEDYDDYGFTDSIYEMRKNKYTSYFEHVKDIE